MKKHLFVFIFFLVACQISDKTANLPHPKSPEQQAQDRFIQQFETRFKAQLAASKCPGAAVVIVRDSTVIFEKGFGLRSSKTRDSVDVHTVFRLASLSKGFTGVLAAKIVSEGLMNWDETVKRIIPAFTLSDAGQAGRVTIRHLLSHSSGLPRHAYTNLIEAGETIDEIMPQFRDVKLIAKEGQVFAYQNAAFAIIEKVLQKKTGVDFPDLIAQNLFRPAGMKDASASYADMVSNPDVAQPHKWNAADSAYHPVPITERYYNTASAGGINASIHDMGIWLQVLLGYRPEVVPLSAIDDAFSPEVASENENRYFRWDGVTSSSYGFGWRIFQFEGRELVYHGGYVNDFRTEIAIDRTNKVGICVLFNAPNDMASTVIPDFFRAYWTKDAPEQ